MKEVYTIPIAIWEVLCFGEKDYKVSDGMEG